MNTVFRYFTTALSIGRTPSDGTTITGSSDVTLALQEQYSGLKFIKNTLPMQGYTMLKYHTGKNFGYIFDDSKSYKLLYQQNPKSAFELSTSIAPLLSFNDKEIRFYTFNNLVAFANLESKQLRLRKEESSGELICETRTSQEWKKCKHDPLPPLNGESNVLTTIYRKKFVVIIEEYSRTGVQIWNSKTEEWHLLPTFESEDFHSIKSLVVRPSDGLLQIEVYFPGTIHTYLFPYVLKSEGIWEYVPPTDSRIERVLDDNVVISIGAVPTKALNTLESELTKEEKNKNLFLQLKRDYEWYNLVNFHEEREYLPDTFFSVSSSDSSRVVTKYSGVAHLKNAQLPTEDYTVLKYHTGNSFGYIDADTKTYCMLYQQPPAETKFSTNVGIAPMVSFNDEGITFFGQNVNVFLRDLGYVIAEPPTTEDTNRLVAFARVLQKKLRLQRISNKLICQVIHDEDYVWRPCQNFPVGLHGKSEVLATIYNEYYVVVVDRTTGASPQMWHGVTEEWLPLPPITQLYDQKSKIESLIVRPSDGLLQVEVYFPDTFDSTISVFVLLPSGEWMEERTKNAEIERRVSGEKLISIGAVPTRILNRVESKIMSSSRNAELFNELIQSQGWHNLHQYNDDEEEQYWYSTRGSEYNTVNADLPSATIIG